MDDTRMDLTQFDEGGHSVPSLPPSHTPPTISVTEPSPPESAEASNQGESITTAIEAESHQSPLTQQQEGESLSALGF